MLPCGANSAFKVFPLGCWVVFALHSQPDLYFFMFSGTTKSHTMAVLCAVSSWLCGCRKLVTSPRSTWSGA